jgi:hypothetical protein
VQSDGEAITPVVFRRHTCCCNTVMLDDRTAVLDDRTAVFPGRQAGTFAWGGLGAARLHLSSFWLSIIRALQEYQIELHLFDSGTRVEWLVS